MSAEYERYRQGPEEEGKEVGEGGKEDEYKDEDEDENEDEDVIKGELMVEG